MGRRSGVQGRALTAGAPKNGLANIGAVAAGNALEFYDFLVYVFFAGQIGRCFFPSKDSLSSLLASLATFGAGFLMRPVGALVLGRMGDKTGRRPAMLLSFGLMGLAVTGLALTPAYAFIGVAAPIAAIGWRLLQGFALGGDVGPSTAFLAETAPAHRRGLYVSLQFTGQYGATFLAGAVGFGLSRALSIAQLDAWGWRLAFLLGAAVAPVALALRVGLDDAYSKVDETPAKTAQKTSRAPIILGFVMLAGATSVTYVLNYLTTYAATTLRMTGAMGFAATATVGLCGMLCAPLGGWLSDRFGRKPIMIAPAVTLLLCALPVFSLIVTFKNPTTLLGGAVLVSACASSGFAVMLCALVEWLPRRRRSGGLGLIYALAISVFGGTTPFTVAWLSGLTHSAMVPAWYMTGAIAACLGAIVFFPETAPRKAA
jgi:MFS family permease